MSRAISAKLTTHIQEAIVEWIDKHRDGFAPVEEVLAALTCAQRDLILRMEPVEQAIAIKCVREGVTGKFYPVTHKTALN